MPLKSCRCGGVKRENGCDRCGKKDDRKRLDNGRYDWEWRKLRSLFLAKNPLCHDCESRGSTIPAVDVHHIRKISVSPELRLDPSNLMGLCKRCHAIRTNRGE